MTKEEINEEACEHCNWAMCSVCENRTCDNTHLATLKCREWRDRRAGYYCGAESREKHIAELEAQIEKLIDFVLSKTECCDVCPITATCINSEGTCPYAEILAKGEEEVTKEWLMRFIAKR